MTPPPLVEDNAILPMLRKTHKLIATTLASIDRGRGQDVLRVSVVAARRLLQAVDASSAGGRWVAR